MKYEYNELLNECPQRLEFIAKLCVVIVADYYEISRILRFKDKFWVNFYKDSTQKPISLQSIDTTY